MCAILEPTIYVRKCSKPVIFLPAYRVCSRSTVKSKLLCALILLVVVATTRATLPVNPEEAAKYARIQQGMKKLLPLLGKWDVAVDFHNQDGTTHKEAGTWTVTSILDDTYLEFQTERHLPSDLKRHRLVLSFVTFNPKSNKYNITFFYNWSPLRVILTGNFDDATQQLRTKGYIPDEDGVNDETVAETFDLKDPKRIVYKHYSMRSPQETAQRLDVEMILTPAT
jgi:hypothetical protein